MDLYGTIDDSFADLVFRHLFVPLCLCVSLFPSSLPDALGALLPLPSAPIGFHTKARRHKVLYSTAPFRIREIPSFIKASPKFKRYPSFIPVNLR